MAAVFTNSQGWIEQASQLIQNETGARGLSPTLIEQVAAAAAVWLSRFVPLYGTKTFTGTGSYLLDLTTGLSPVWTQGFSRIDALEYPTGLQERSILTEETYELYPDAILPTSIQLRTVSPGLTDTVRLSYTALHVISDSSSTVPASQAPGFVLALASRLCPIYAARYGHSTQSGVVGDSLDGLPKADFWLRLEKVYLDQASGSLGVDLSEGTTGGSSAGAAPGSSQPYGRFVDFDPFYGRSDLLLRNRWNR